MVELQFLRPYWFLALIPVLILLWLLWQRKYQSRGWRAVCDPRLLPYLLTSPSGRRKRWPLLLSGLLSFIVIMALAGPVWDKLPQPVYRDQSALVIILDLSRSMDAGDINPSRLARARHKIIDILQRRKEGQTALLVYAAEAYTVSPLTEDSKTIVALAKTLTTDLMPEQGSEPARALPAATKLLQQAGVPHGHILLITDGIENAAVESLAKLATDQGHRLSVLGIGTRVGAPIKLESGGFLKDPAGAIVIPKLDPAALQRLAQLGGGRSHLLSADDRDLIYILAGVNGSHIQARGKETTFNADQWREEGPWLLLFVLPFAALAFRRGYLVLLVLFCLPSWPQPVYALEWDQLWQRPEQRAAQLLRQNKASAPPPAAEVFSEPEWRASAHYRAGQYQQAVDALQGLSHAEALYNKGNALAKMGKLQEALEAYTQALQQAPEHADAKYNQQQVKQKLEQQQGENKDKSSSDEQDGDKQDGDKQAGDKQNSSEQQKQSGQESDAQEKNQQDEAEKKAQEQTSQQQAEADEAKQDKSEQQQQPGQESEQDAQEPQQAMAETEENNPEQKERTQAMEQWLRRIPDDPGGLLRRKFQYQSQRQRQMNQARGNNNGQEQW